MKKRVVAGVVLLTFLAVSVRLAACTLEDKPMSRVEQTVHPDRIQPMLGAVMNSETDEVKRLAEQHRGLNERSPDDQTTPMIYAAATDQWLVVEILIDHGADIWVHSKFGDTAANYTSDSRILPGSLEDAARLRVITKLKARGYPFPSPSPDEILALDKAGKWPPRE